MNFRVRLVRLNDSLFFDAMSPDTPALHDQCLTCLPMHMIGRLRVEEDALHIDLFDARWLEDRAREKGLVAVRRSGDSDALVLVGDTAALRKFVEDAADEPGAFVEATDDSGAGWRRY
jgi:hypothetical protein